MFEQSVEVKIPIINWHVMSIREFVFISLSHLIHSEGEEMDSHAKKTNFS